MFGDTFFGHYDEESKEFKKKIALEKPLEVSFTQVMYVVKYLSCKLDFQQYIV